MRDDVYGLVSLAIVHTRELGIVRQFVEYLDAIYGLRWQRVKRRRDILAEELLTVDEDLLHLLALSLHRAVRYGYTWHLLQQALDVGIGGHLKCCRVVCYRIAILRCT